MSSEVYSTQDVMDFMLNAKNGQLIIKHDPEYIHLVQASAENFFAIDPKLQTRVAIIISRILNYLYADGKPQTLSHTQINAAIKGVQIGQRIRARLEEINL